MSQYNKTVLTRAGLELAKKANAGQAKFGITRAVTSADDWSGKTTQDLEDVTAIPNIMQQGTIMDAEEVESNNSVIGVSLKFTNKDLINGYQIRIIGLYVKEEGQKNDFLYAVTTAITPEYMPNFADKVLYRFNMQMYLVIGKAQAVNVVIDEGTAVTHSQFDKYKGEVTGNLKKLENTHKEDMSHVAKSASINGGAEILPDSTGKLNLVVPDPDLSKYVSLEQLGELLQAKADKADVNKQIKAVTDLANAKANIDDVNNAKSSLTSSINAVNNKVNVTVPLFRRITADNTWNDILGASNVDAHVLVSIRDEGGANTLGNFSAAVAFGGGDTKGVLNVAYSDHTARIIGGNGDAPVWHEDIAWKSDISNLQNIINQQNQTIQSLTSRLNNAENEINYIKANYIEGRRFAKSQEAQATAWENENPQRIAFITDN